MKARLFVLCVACAAATYAAGALEPAVEVAVETLEEMLDTTVTGWKFHKGDPEGAERADFDDSEWEPVGVGHSWQGDNTVAWYRTVLVVPESVGGLDVTGSQLRLDITIDDKAVVYVNGEHAADVAWTGLGIPLVVSAVPNSRIVIAVKGINHGGPGRLMHASLDISAVTPLRESVKGYADDVKLAAEMIERAGNDVMRDAIAESAGLVDLEALPAGDVTAFTDSIARASEALAPIEPLAKSYKVHLVGHAHIDMNWLWEWPETVEVCRKTFTDMMDLMDKFPDFKFSQSQSHVYLTMHDYHPEVYDRIREKVRAGQWEITAGTWTEGDTNMPSGEGIARAILYSKRYVRKNFGVDVKIAWEPDTFGHAWTLPQILSKAGITRYYHARCGRGIPLYWWEGPDGSRILVYNHENYNDQVCEGAANLPLRVEEQTGLRVAMLPYGVGDHGGGPRMSDIETKLRLDKRKVFPELQYSTTDAFFSEVEARSDGIPVINDEVNFVFEGCYTTHADIKLMNRRSEVLFPETEIFSALAMPYGVDYPREEMVDAWRVTGFNHFHDILDGSAIHPSYAYSQELFDAVEAEASAFLEKATTALAQAADTTGRGTPVVVFNPLSWARTDAVVMDTPVDAAPGRSVVVTGPDGVEVPAQVGTGPNGPQLVFIARDVPAMGYSVYHVRSGRTRAVPAGDELRVRSDGGIENEHLAVWVDEASGTVSRLLLKDTGREVFPGGRAGLLQMLYERPHGMSAWIVGPISRTVDLDEADSVELVEQGPARTVVRVTHSGGSSSFTQDVTLYAGVPRVDFRLTAGWWEVGTCDVDAPMLKVSFPLPEESKRAIFEIPYGAIERGTTGAEVPSQKFIDVSMQGGWGLGLLNDCKHGHDVTADAMRLTLLRSSYDPDPIPDQGIHHITYSIYPHEGDWDAAGVTNRGYELNYPLLPVVSNVHDGELPASHSFLTVEPEGVIVTALKLAEDDDTLVLRAYESRGRPTNVRFRWGLPVAAARECDIMEWEDLGPVVVSGGESTLRFGKWDIRTLRLSRGRE